MRLALAPKAVEGEEDEVVDGAVSEQQSNRHTRRMGLDRVSQERDT